MKNIAYGHSNGKFSICGEKSRMYIDENLVLTNTHLEVLNEPPEELAKAYKAKLPIYKEYFASLKALPADWRNTPIGVELARKINRLWHEATNNDHLFPELPSEDDYLLWPQEVLKPKQGEVTYGVSYTYNGGTTYRSKWYKGYKCQPPIVPKGFRLVGIGVGFEFNAHPPLATARLERIKP